MRITFVVNHGNLTGGIRVIAIYAERLKRRGHDICVVARPRPIPPFKRRIKSMLRGKGWIADPNTLPSHLDQLSEVGVEHRVIDSRRPITDRDVPDADVVIATWWETVFWVDALSHSKGAKAYFVQDFGAHESQPMDQLALTWRLPMHKLVISHYIRDLVRQYIPESEPLSYVPNSVDPEQFHAPTRGKQPTPMVGMVYSSSRFKGSDIALKAFELACRQVPELRLIGFGLRDQSSEPLPSGATITSRVPDNKLKEIYGGCDAWIFPPRKEGFGLPILEAMACRTPVIATPAGAAPELLSRGGGMLVPHEDPVAMSEAVLKICRCSEQDWRALSNAAYATANSFTWDDATDMFESALQMAVQRSEKLVASSAAQ